MSGFTVSSPRAAAEQKFAQAAAYAALFELRVRLCAGKAPITDKQSIDTKLKDVLDEIIKHHDEMLNAEERKVLTRACRLRNKVLHCEFSSACELIDPEGSHSRAGGVERITGVTRDNIKSTVGQINAGGNAGQNAVAATPTKKHKDVIGWLLNAHGAGEFEAASSLFQRAIDVLDRCSERAADD